MTNAEHQVPVESESKPEAGFGINLLLERSLFYLKLVWYQLSYVLTTTEPERYHSNLGVTYFNHGHYWNAIEQFQKSERARHGKDTSFARYNLYYLGFSFINVEKFTEAIAHFEEYLRLKPSDDYVKEVISWCRDQMHSERQ